MTNLHVLKRSNKKPQSGDIFAMQIPDGRYLFGRVIESNLSGDLAPMPTSNLVYVYRVFSDTKSVPLEELTTANLLIPPKFVNRKLWTLGYAETVAHAPVHTEDRLAQHSFLNIGVGYVDEFGRPLSSKIEPCGVWAMGNHRTLDDEISQALSIPLAPPSPGDQDYSS